MRDEGFGAKGMRSEVLRIPRRLATLLLRCRSLVANTVLTPLASLFALRSSLVARCRDMQYLKDLDVFEGGNVKKKWAQEVQASYNDNPASTTGEPQERMREFYAGRNTMHVYDKAFQNAKVVYFPQRHRMLTHFYSFIFAEDWRVDLWAKR